ncbi:STAS-like domain-containing protein [Advenella mimigardefordensis]|uniref:DUF4325 domain-containing protein n=1 Tax=Advenella mimigardefordensis (strain DSM 17166 / LMG 22922 / DPN7) TaxID=1247726 RepID=W0PBU4_ADVMD|nr:STAS-like domain-containing protein [Advenella mimigardefordensis]AHG64334.1 hypothetical protein MIM_c22580 [Advenella mimigardefordensis DPN7]
MTKSLISISKQYSRFPAGRYRKDGPYSGERFRDEILIPALRDNQEVTVDLDNVMGFGSSFLEEAFGGLMRHGVSYETIVDKLHIKSSVETYKNSIKQYMLDQSKRNM